MKRNIRNAHISKDTRSGKIKKSKNPEETWRINLDETIAIEIEREKRKANIRNKTTVLFEIV